MCICVASLCFPPTQLVALAPTAFNCNPLRVRFVRSTEAKDKLEKTLMAGNVAQTRAAPVTAILCVDNEWLSKMDTLSPNYDVKPIFSNNAEAAKGTGDLNARIQAGYFILTARALGLNCGPMSGFDNAAVDAAFLEGTGLSSVVLVNLGTGIPENRYPRAPRLSFEDACKIL